MIYNEIEIGVAVMVRLEIAVVIIALLTAIVMGAM